MTYSGYLASGYGPTWASEVNPPVLVVEFAPGVSPTVEPTAGQWVDITARCAALAISIGGSEVSQPGAGTLDIMADNADGNLDPDNATGPYYPNLKPRTWIRVLAASSAVLVPVVVWTGKVSLDGFRVEHKPPADSVTRITAQDALEDLANARLPSSVHVVEVEADSPRSWWRLSEPSGTVARDSSGNGHHGEYEGQATFNRREGLVKSDENGSIEFVPGRGFNAPAGSLPSSPAGAITIEFWMQTDFATAATQWLAYTTNANNGLGLWFSADELNFRIWPASGGEAHVYLQGLINDGKTHHIAAVYDSAVPGVDGHRIYVDGTPAETLWLSARPSLPPASNLHINLVPHLAGFTGLLDEFAVYDTALSQARIAAHHAAGTRPWEGDTTGERMTRLADLIDWPATHRAFSAGSSTMPATGLGTDALTAMQAIATADGGRLDIDHADGGKLRFWGRADMMTAARARTSQATFGDGSGEVPYERMPAFVTDRIVNSVAAQRFGGSTFTVEDTASIAAYQPRSANLTGLLVQSDSEVISRANWLLAQSANERRVARSVTLTPRAGNHAAWDEVFTRRIGDRVTVAHQTGYGTTASHEAVVEGVEHRWEQRSHAWSTTFRLSPAGMGTAANARAFVVSESTVGGADRIAY